MTAENLYNLVQGLSREQKTRFTRFTKGARKSLDLVLYDRLLAAKSYDEKSAAKIRGKEFRNATQFYLYRCKLAERIIQSLVMYEQDRFDPAEFIRKAVQLDAVSLAEKVWIEELTAAQKVEDYPKMVFLHELAADLKEVYRIRFERPDNLIDYKEVRRRQELHFSYENVLDQVREAFSFAHDSRNLTARTLAGRVREMDQPTYRSEVLNLKCQVGIGMLLIDYERTMEVQDKLIRHMANAPYVFPLAQQVYEYTTMIQMSILAGMRDISVRYSLVLSRMQAKHPIERRILSAESIQNQFVVGEFYSNLDLIEQGLAALKANASQFTERRRAYLEMMAALVYFYHDDHTNAARYLRRVRAIPVREREFTSWEPEAVLATIHYERGNVGVFDSLIRTAQAAASETGGKYPALGLKLLRTLSQAPLKKRNEVTQDYLSQMQMLFLSPKEERLAQKFNLAIWLQAKVWGVSQASIIHQRGKSRAVPKVAAQ